MTATTRARRRTARGGAAFVQAVPGIPAETPQPSLHEETVNTLTHGGGLVLGVAGAVVLMDAVRQAESWLIAGCAIYAASLVGVFAASTLSHAVREPARRRWFRALDQGAIYLVIAGTFTPFALVYLSGGAWWLLLAAMWGTALAGFCAKVLWRHQTESISLAVYLVPSWLPLLAAEPILHSVPAAGVGWILAGGLCYMLGTVFLAYDERARYFHAVWHLLVIAGTACHYHVILRYVVSSQGL